MAAVHKIFATFEDAAAKMPVLFPDSSKSEANSSFANFVANPDSVHYVTPRIIVRWLGKINKPYPFTTRG
jgi:hypothetical protein